MEEAQALPNSLEDFAERFEALMEEANGYGFEGVVLLLDQDMFGRKTTLETVRKCCPYRAIGALATYRARVMGELSGPEA